MINTSENVNLRYGIGSIFISVFNFVFKIREFGGKGLLLFAIFRSRWIF